MTPEQIALVQDSFKKVVPIATNAADLFYDRLFAIAPEFRAMFPQDLRDQKKKLIAMLATVVANLHELEKMLPAVQDLGRRHMTYGVTADHYTPVGEALLWALEQGLGTDFTPAVKAAWNEAYLTLSGSMKNAATGDIQAGSPGNVRPNLEGVEAMHLSTGRQPADAGRA